MSQTVWYTTARRAKGGGTGKRATDRGATSAIATKTNPIDIAIRRIASVAALSEREQDFIRSLPHTTDSRRRGVILVTEGSRTQSMTFVISGWACRQRFLPDGRRQILGFALPGDILDVGILSGGTASTSIVTITPVELLKTPIPAEMLRSNPELCKTDGSGDGSARIPELVRLDLLASKLELARAQDHVLRLGRQTAYERMAHLLLELHGRLGAVGLTRGPVFSLPLTQEALADALGLSIVHINRTLQQLRADRLVEMGAGVVKLLDADALAAIADFSPNRSIRMAS
jgi:CRP-like cAMP-binding protein